MSQKYLFVVFLCLKNFQFTFSLVSTCIPKINQNDVWLVFNLWWKPPRERIIRGVTPHFSNPERGTVWTTTLKKIPNTYIPPPSHTNILDKLSHFSMNSWGFPQPHASHCPRPSILVLVTWNMKPSKVGVHIPGNLVQCSTAYPPLIAWTTSTLTPWRIGRYWGGGRLIPLTEPTYHSRDTVVGEFSLLQNDDVCIIYM